MSAPVPSPWHRRPSLAVWVLGASVWFAVSASLGGTALYPLVYGWPVMAVTLSRGPGAGALLTLWGYVLLVGLGDGHEAAHLVAMAAMTLGAHLARRWR